MNMLRIIVRSILFRIVIFAVLGIFGYSRVSDSNVDETTRDTTGGVVQAGSVGVDVLQLGDCILFPNGGLGNGTEVFVEKFEVVPCTELHDGQIGGQHVLPDGLYPGKEYLESEYGKKICWNDYDAFTNTDIKNPPHEVIPGYPSEESWSLGGRVLNCVFVMADGGKLGASIEG